MRRLADRFRIVFIGHQGLGPEQTRDAEVFLRDHGIEPVVVECSVAVNGGPLFYGRLAANLLSPLPYSVQRHSTAQMQTAVRRMEIESRINLWQVEWTPYAQSLRGRVHSPWVVMAHNIESQIWRRYYETETNPLKKWYIGRQFRKYLDFERVIFNEAGEVIVVSEPDARLAHELYGRSEVEVVSNGVDIDHYLPGTTPRDSKAILYVGALFWRPNLDAVQVLLREVLPRVLAEEPDARLQVVGRDPPPWLAAEVARASNATLYPSVPDVRPFLQGCGLLAVPLRIGGGSRLKILEALACRCPVVSTSVGSEGLDLVDGRDYIRADDPAEMAAAIVRCIRDPRLANELARSGRDRILESYSWDPLAQRLGEIWETRLRTAARPGAPPRRPCGLSSGQIAEDRGWPAGSSSEEEIDSRGLA
ncbi:glycosyltransferase family 4 protein [Aquisphaera insulae]|uniref:glycosyltransferase family 4 protein n=1 Tax=Aquisphaera insulae TaxID=2712864 RepID=UPI00202E2A62|nr:glycosyltransferase family 4 protein [Aquisphaera insulae]